MNKYISYILTALIPLITLLVIQDGCNGYNNGDLKPDTVFVKEYKWRPSAPVFYKDTTHTSYKQIIPKDIPNEYNPDTNCNKLGLQYKNIVIKHSTENFYKDSVNLDTLGYYKYNLSVKENKLHIFDFAFYPNYKEVNNTLIITNPQKPVRQIYVSTGVGYVFVNKIDSSIALSMSVGLAYKDRKDRVYKIDYKRNTINQQSIEVERLWKISFKRNKK